jgi:hypothetical protein
MVTTYGLGGRGKCWGTATYAGVCEGGGGGEVDGHKIVEGGEASETLGTILRHVT